MNNIEGNVLITTDWHIGLKQNSKSRLAIIINVVKEILNYVKNNNIKTIIFAGDLFHERVAVNVNSLNVALKCIKSLAKYCKIYLIVGNHDSHLKNSIDINSLNIFKDTPNVDIISQTTEVSVNGNKTLLVPWLGDYSKYENETFDMLIGHFDISTKYLITSYMKDHANSTSNVNHCDLVGDFIDKVKKFGVLFSGHIHGRKEFISKGRTCVIVGDPYQQNLGEIDYSCGFYTLDNENKYKFIAINSVPKHINIRISDVVKDIEKYDFSKVKNNIIHKIYDIEVDAITDAKICQKINDLMPYEELLPDYAVSISNNDNNNIQNDSIELIKKSKLEYIKNYISNIDKATLDAQNIDPIKLYSILEDYYNNVTEEK